MREGISGLEIATAILSGGTTSNYIYKTPGRANIAHCFIAIDYGMFGDKKEIEAKERVLKEGVSLNEKTYAEMEMIGEFTKASEYLEA